MSVTSQQAIQILHVDDEPSIADLTRTFLERESDQFTVETATSADEGLDILADRPPDCVVSDYNMPGMDGIEFLQAVRDEYPDLPFILFTGKGSEAVASDAISAGVTDYLQKDSGSEQYELLANRIRNAVRARREIERADRQEQLMRLTEFAGDTGGFELNVDSGGLLLTDGTHRLVGLPDDTDLTLAEAIELYHPDDQADVRQTINQAAETGEQTRGTWRLQTSNGDQRLTDVTITPATENSDVTTLRGSVHDVTERRERRQELEQTRDMLSDMEELAGIGAWEYDSHTETLVLTDGARQIYQLEPDTDLTLEEAFEYFHPEDRGQLTDRFNECLDTGESYGVDVRLVTAEGTQKWVTAQGERVEESGPEGVVRGYIQDVTEKKTRERQLTELNQVSNDLLTAETREEAADIGVRAAGEILGLRANAIHLYESDNAWLTPVAHTDELTALLDEVPALSMTDSIAGRVYQRGEPTVVEDAHQDSDVHNPETDLRGHAYLPLGEHGILIAGSEEQAAFDQQDLALGDLLAGTLTAAFERIDREQTTRRQQQKLALFFEESPLGAVQWDDEFRFERLNDTAEKILGYEEDELRGESWETIVDEDDRDYIADTVDELLAADGGTHAINKNTGKTGETRVCKWHNRAVTDADGDVRTIFSKFEDITEQEERKRELRAVKGQYQTLVENFPNGAVFLYDTDQRVIRAGGSELASVGLAPEGIEGTTPHDRYPAEIAEELGHNIEQAFAGDSPTFEQEYGGEHYRVQVAPVRTDDGEITHVIAVSENITERKERRQKLEQYERLVENLPVGVFRTTTDGEIVDMNEATTDIYGADSRAQLRKMEAEELYKHDADRTDLLDQLQEAGQVENELVEFETLDGDRRFVRATFTLNEEAGSRYLEGILQDVTDRRELEREFAQIKTIAESLNDAVYVIDDNGQFTYVNDELLELTGYPEEIILGNTPDLIKDEETVKTAERKLGALLSDDGPDTVTFETTIQPDSGSPVVCEDHMGVLPYDGDSFNGSVGVLRDITERKRRERELRQERNRLDEFASVVSHDLRNPLTVADGRLELAQENCESDHLAQAANAIDRSRALIEDVLTLAREGEDVSEIKSVGLADVAESGWQTVESQSATLEAYATQTLQADQSRLTQLFENLYRNAIEHGGDGVTVSVGKMDDGFYVADTGPGIPEGDREEVFEAGYSTNEDGTGFGLRIVRQVADAHGWEIAVTESEQGGARFEVTGVEFDDQ